MKRSWMIEEVGSYLYGYLKDGTVQIDSILKRNVSVDRLHDLLKLRLMKHERTIAFMKLLENGLTSIKSSTKANIQESYFEVRGEINWQETLQKRMQSNPKDRFHFTIQESERTFNTVENLVLKAVLVKLELYCYDDRFLTQFDSRSWYQDVIAARKNVRAALHHNIYVSRIGEQPVTNRMIEKVKSHRKPIYREAAHLLARIRKMENGDYTQQQLQDVLHEFFILPANEDVLFELYWIVQILKQQNNVVYSIMDGNGTKVASWADDEYDVSLYHNSVGSGSIKFMIHRNELLNSSNAYLNQEVKAIDRYNALAKSIFHVEKSLIYWRGRPDILIEKVHRGTNTLCSIVIGEIKNTESLEYASQGLKELTQYMAYAKNSDNEYIADTDIGIQGLLCLGEIPLNDSFIDNVQVVSLRNKEMVLNI